MLYEPGLHFINISARAYQYIRQFSIKSVDDALVELITNSIDAYKKTSFVQRKIDIEIYNPNIIVIRDYAIGLDAAGLERCFLSVGNFTASDTSRGFFSRGAKDISAIGNIYFTGIKNNSIAQCFLNTDAYGQITLHDTPVTDDYRKEFRMPAPNNGLEVEIQLLPSYQNINPQKLAVNISKTAVLREIFADPNNVITMYDMNDDGEPMWQQRLQYTYPTASNVLFLEYNVPGYTQYKAKFCVNQTTTPISQPAKESQLEFGFMIKDSTSVYEINTLDVRFRWNPYINYIYGYISCDGIHDLLLEYDRNGPTIANPFPVIDPSRITGVNTQHPFIIALYSIPLVRLDYILRQLNVSKSTTSISIDELSDLMNELNNLGEQIIKDNSVSVNWQNNYDSTLVQAITDDRMKYVEYEQIYEQADDFTVEEAIKHNKILDEITKNQINDPNINYPDTEPLYVSDQDTVVPLQNVNLTELSHDPVRTLELLPPNIKDILNINPYIYQLNKNGTLNKLYIFSKGTFSHNTPSTNMKLRNKTFTIIFINDLNVQDRYIIDSSQGIQIKINLNNPIVKKYLSPAITTNTSNTTETTDTTATTSEEHKLNSSSIASFTSVRALIFLKELLIDAIANVVVGSDVLNKKILLDSDSYNNLRKMVDYKSKVITKVELYIDGIFSKYIANTTNLNSKSILDIISDISQNVSSHISINEDLATLHQKLVVTVQEVVSK